MHPNLVAESAWWKFNFETDDATDSLSQHINQAIYWISHAFFALKYFFFFQFYKEFFVCNADF